MGFGIGSITGAFKSAADWVGDKVEDGAKAVGSAAEAVADTAEDVVEHGAKALDTARDFVGDRLEDVDRAKAWVGEKIDGAVKGAEHAVDGFREDLVEFGEEHGGIVGKAVAQSVSNTIGLTEGATLAVYDMGKGVVQLADGASKLVNPLEWAARGDENLTRLENTGKAALAIGSLASPIGWAVNGEGNADTAKALWNGVTEGYQDAAKNGDWSKFIGRGVVDVGSFFIGAGEANAAIKGARAADAVADGARVLDAAADVGKATRGADAAADAGRIADGARAARMGTPADKVAEIVKNADAATLDKIKSTSTFVTNGLDNAAAEAFLKTADGQEMMRVMSAADPGADATKIYGRAMDLLSTGSKIPEVKPFDDALVKIVPHGEGVSAYTPFFATMDDLQAAAKSGQSLADAFGLPIRSEAAVYDIYQIAPKGADAKVFVQTIAPTSELGGAVVREGGALQYLVLNRGEWTDAVKIGSIPN